MINKTNLMNYHRNIFITLLSVLMIFSSVLGTEFNYRRFKQKKDHIASKNTQPSIENLITIRTRLLEDTKAQLKDSGKVNKNTCNDIQKNLSQLKTLIEDKYNRDSINYYCIHDPKKLETYQQELEKLIKDENLEQKEIIHEQTKLQEQPNQTQLPQKNFSTIESQINSEKDNTPISPKQTFSSPPQNNGKTFWSWPWPLKIFITIFSYLFSWLPW